jgi:hypothetical protein
VDTLHILKKANKIMCAIKPSTEWEKVIEYLNEQGIDYYTESGRDTRWTDIEMYIYYLEHK